MFLYQNTYNSSSHDGLVDCEGLWGEGGGLDPVHKLLDPAVDAGVLPGCGGVHVLGISINTRGQQQPGTYCSCETEQCHQLLNMI